MTWSMVWSIFTKVVDICIVWLVFYYILKNIKNNTKMVLIFKGVILILFFKCMTFILS